MNRKKLCMWTDQFFIAGAILVNIPYTLLITAGGISTSSLQIRRQPLSLLLENCVLDEISTLGNTIVPRRF